MAIGFSPKYVNTYSEEDLTAFQKHLSYSEVAPFGEVGLDYTTSPSMWGLLHLALDKVLKHLQPAHVLDLHAREAYYQLFFQLKGVVLSEQKIYLHYFEGDRKLTQDWLKEFPNTRLDLRP